MAHVSCSCSRTSIFVGFMIPMPIFPPVCQFVLFHFFIVGFFFFCSFIEIWLLCTQIAQRRRRMNRNRLLHDTTTISFVIIFFCLILSSWFPSDTPNSRYCNDIKKYHFKQVSNRLIEMILITTKKRTKTRLLSIDFKVFIETVRYF